MKQHIATMRQVRWALVCVIVSLIVLAAAYADEVAITHGPILGRLRADSVGVWARTSRPAAFYVRIGTSPDALDRATDAVNTMLAHDNTGWILVNGLQPATTYYYRVEITDAPNRDDHDGAFRTLPTPEVMSHPELNPDGLFNLSFEFACGNKPLSNPGDGPLRPSFVTMLRELDGKLDFAILNGDWLYEKKRDYPTSEWLNQVGARKTDTPRIVSLAPSIVGVWENYKDYLENDPNLAAWHREVPSFFTADDHETLNDVNGAGEIGFRGVKAVFRDIGLRAWHDYLGWSMTPALAQDARFDMARLEAGSDILTDLDANFSDLDLDQTAELHVHWGGQYAGTPPNVKNPGGGDPNAGVYEVVEIIDAHRLRIRPPARETKQSAYSIGRYWFSKMRLSNCEFFFLDTRSHRQLHDISNPGKPGVSLLGMRQKQWLMDNMRRSDATFFFVVSSVNFMIPHIAPNAGRAGRVSNKDEAWTAFLDEREQMIDFWNGLGKPVFILTGDLHNSFAIKITERVWEFASGPHSSTNHSTNHEAGRPANGVYKHGPRACEIRWSSYVLPDLGRKAQMPHYCVVQVNNVFRNPALDGGERWVAFPRPHVMFQYYDGLTGELRYAESIFATP